MPVACMADRVEETTVMVASEVMEAEVINIEGEVVQEEVEEEAIHKVFVAKKLVFGMLRSVENAKTRMNAVYQLSL